MSRTKTFKAYLKFKGKLKGETEERWHKPTMTLPEIKFSFDIGDSGEIFEADLTETIGKWFSKNYNYNMTPITITIVEHTKDFIENVEINCSRKLHEFVIFEAEAHMNKLDALNEEINS